MSYCTGIQRAPKGGGGWWYCVGFILVFFWGGRVRRFFVIWGLFLFDGVRESGSVHTKKFLGRGWAIAVESATHWYLRGCTLNKRFWSAKWGRGREGEGGGGLSSPDGSYWYGGRRGEYQCWRR